MSNNTLPGADDPRLAAWRQIVTAIDVRGLPVPTSIEIYFDPANRSPLRACLTFRELDPAQRWAAYAGCEASYKPHSHNGRPGTERDGHEWHAFDRLGARYFSISAYVTNVPAVAP